MKASGVPRSTFKFSDESQTIMSRRNLGHGTLMSTTAHKEGTVSQTRVRARAGAPASTCPPLSAQVRDASNYLHSDIVWKKEIPINVGAVKVEAWSEISLLKKSSRKSPPMATPSASEATSGGDNIEHGHGRQSSSSR